MPLIICIKSWVKCSFPTCISSCKIHPLCDGVHVAEAWLNKIRFLHTSEGKSTFCRQVVDKEAEGGEEHTRNDDVDDVEEGLSLDYEEEDYLLVLSLMLLVLSVDHLLGRPVFDSPLTIFWQSHKTCFICWSTNTMTFLFSTIL